MPKYLCLVVFRVFDSQEKPYFSHFSRQVAPVAGMALLHIHGAKCMLHEARAVTKNIKYVLRSDVVFA